MAKTTLAPPSTVSEQPGRPKIRISPQVTFAALKHPNYRLWFFGQMVSLFGTWMQSTAQGYLVYQLTHSPQYLGYVGFAAGVPSWLLMLYGGLVADRMPRRNLLMITQASMMLLAFILAGLTFSGLIQAWHIIIMAFLLGIANAFDAPARMAFVREMVSRKDLTNAIALNAMMFNSATAVGPAVAGITYAALGPAWCFTINGVSFLAVILALGLMRIEYIPAAVERGSSLKNIQAGFRYVASNLIVRSAVVNIMVLSLFGLGFITLLPAWAVKVLGGDATTNGLLQSGRGVGALIGALMVASLSGFVTRGRLLTVGSFVFPSVLLVYAAMRWLPLSLLALVGIGWGFMVLANSSNALVQGQVPDELRGRVMSIYSLTFFGMMPLGALLSGALAERIGEPLTVSAGALVMLGYAILLWWRVPELRRAG